MPVGKFHGMAQALLAKSVEDFGWSSPLRLCRPQSRFLQGALETYVLKVANDACYKAGQHHRVRVTVEDWLSAEARGYACSEEDAVQQLQGRNDGQHQWGHLPHDLGGLNLRKFFCFGRHVQVTPAVLAAALCTVIACADAVLRGTLIYVENGGAAKRKVRQIVSNHLLAAISAPIPRGLAVKLTATQEWCTF